MSARPARTPLRLTARTLFLLGATGVATLGLTLLAAGPASAHVTASASTTAPGSYGIVTISVPHGCDGSATTKIDIKVPDQLTSVTPTVLDGWTVTKKNEKLKTPITDDGETITTRTSEVTYTAETPLPEGYRAAFELSVQLPEQAGPLSFPTVQTCERGETAWIEEPAEGQSEDSVEHPAPAIEVGGDTSTGSDDEESESSPSAGTGVDASIAPATDATTTGASTGAPAAAGWAGLGLGAVGAVLGGVALARTRKS